MNELRQKALDFATKAHEGQTRKDGVTPYINHPIAVAEIALKLVEHMKLSDDELDILYCVAIEHDMEDCDVTYQDLVDNFGHVIAEQVDKLTHKPGQNYLDKVLLAKYGVYSRIVKIADNIHNMSDLKEGSLKDKYRLSKYILEN